MRPQESAHGEARLRALGVGIACLLISLPLVALRWQLLDGATSPASVVVVLWSGIFPATFAFILYRFWLGPARAGVWVAVFLLYAIGLAAVRTYLLDRGGLPSLSQWRQADEAFVIAPRFAAQLGLVGVSLLAAPIIGAMLLRWACENGRTSVPGGWVASFAWIAVLSTSTASAGALLELKTDSTLGQLLVREPNETAARLGLVWFTGVQLNVALGQRWREAPVFPGEVQQMLGGADDSGVPPAGVTRRAPAAATQPDLIWIQVESLEPSLIEDPRFVDAMPFLRSLADRGVLFSSFWAHRSAGGSSDAELASMTSLLPLSTHSGLATFQGEHPTLPRILRKQGYRTLAFHGYRPTYYGRNRYMPALGFDRFVAGSELTGEPETLDVSELATFSGVLRVLAEETRAAKHERPLFALVITVQGHGPYRDVSSYLRDMNAVDAALEHFFEGLGNLRSGRETIVFLYGDHLGGVIDQPTEGKDRVPLIVTVPGRIDRGPLEAVSDQPASHLDLAPTALRLLGLPQASGWLGSPLWVGQEIGRGGGRVVLFNDLTVLELDPLRGQVRFRRDQRGVPALQYSAAVLDP